MWRSPFISKEEKTTDILSPKDKGKQKKFSKLRYKRCKILLTRIK